MTRDINLVAQLDPADADRLAVALGDEFGADVDTLRTAIARRGLFNVIHERAIVKVDFVVLKDTAYRLEEFGRRRLVEVDGHPFWIVAPEDLIFSKLVWASDSHSELQLRDVRGVLMQQKATLDRAYLDQWAARLSVDGLLREVES